MPSTRQISRASRSPLQDKQAKSVGEVLQNDPGVRVARGFGNFQESYFIRGFVLSSDDVAYNGLYSLLPRQYIGTELFGGPIQKLFDWNDQNGPATELQSRIASVDIEGSIATVRLELDNWTGHRFTDMFTLLKVDGEWKILSKIFYLHP